MHGIKKMEEVIYSKMHLVEHHATSHGMPCDMRDFQKFFGAKLFVGFCFYV